MFRFAHPATIILAHLRDPGNRQATAATSAPCVEGSPLLDVGQAI